MYKRSRGQDQLLLFRFYIIYTICLLFLCLSRFTDTTESVLGASTSNDWGGSKCRRSHKYTYQQMKTSTVSSTLAITKTHQCRDTTMRSGSNSKTPVLQTVAIKVAGRKNRVTTAIDFTVALSMRDTRAIRRDESAMLRLRILSRCEILL
jgi:hypothetical protein